MDMKKIMAALAVAGVATAGFAVVESPNIVGYTGTAMPASGAKGMGASFFNVTTGGTMTYADIQVTGYTGEISGTDINMKKLDSAGRGVGKVAFWLDCVDEGDKYYGWYDEDWESLNATTLSSGEGLWVYCNNDTYQLQSSGQVPGAAVAVSMPASGAKLIVNPMPAPLTYGDITVTGYTGEISGTDINMKKLDSAGRGTGKVAFWLDCIDEGDTYYGWYDEDWESLNNTPLAIGEALWVYCNDSTKMMNFPSPVAE